MLASKPWLQNLMSKRTHHIPSESLKLVAPARCRTSRLTLAQESRAAVSSCYKANIPVLRDVKDQLGKGRREGVRITPRKPFRLNVSLEECWDAAFIESYIFLSGINGDSIWRENKDYFSTKKDPLVFLDCPCSQRPSRPDQPHVNKYKLIILE